MLVVTTPEAIDLILRVPDSATTNPDAMRASFANTTHKSTGHTSACRDPRDLDLTADKSGSGRRPYTLDTTSSASPMPPMARFESASFQHCSDARLHMHIASRLADITSRTARAITMTSGANSCKSENCQRLTERVRPPVDPSAEHAAISRYNIPPSFANQRAEPAVPVFY